MCVGSDICSWEMSVSLGCVSDVLLCESVCVNMNVYVCGICLSSLCVVCRYICFVRVYVCHYVCVRTRIGN